MAKENKNDLAIAKLRTVLEDRLLLSEHCLVRQSIALIADKWTMLILMALVQETKRNRDLQRQIQGISPKMLTQTLKKLTACGMVNRVVYAEVPPKVEYSLTKFGESTALPLAAILDWTMEWESHLRSLI